MKFIAPLLLIYALASVSIDTLRTAHLAAPAEAVTTAPSPSLPQPPSECQDPRLAEFAPRTRP